MLGGGDADVHRWLMEHGAYSGTMGNVSDRKRGRLRVKGRERERVHRWLVQQGAYSGTMGNVSDMVTQRDRK